MEHHEQTETMILPADSPGSIKKVSTFLSDNKLVALPTETVYGLAANAFCDQAVQKIFQVKNRPIKNPLIVHAKNLDQACELIDFSRCQSKKCLDRLMLLSQAFWPGPLSVVAKSSKKISPLARANLETVALRVPNQKHTLALLETIDFPLVMPSANASTRPSPTKAFHVEKTLAGKIACILDAGPCPIGIESSIVRIDENKVQLLRKGMISKNALEICLKENVLDCTKPKGQKPLSPGQAFLHYAPHVSQIIPAKENSMEEYWKSTCTILGRENDFSSLEDHFGLRNSHGLNLILPNCPHRFAAKLYDALYESEKRPRETLLIIFPDEPSEQWSAAIDRLKKACGLSGCL